MTNKDLLLNDLKDSLHELKKLLNNSILSYREKSMFLTELQMECDMDYYKEQMVQELGKGNKDIDLNKVLALGLLIYFNDEPEYLNMVDLPTMQEFVEYSSCAFDGMIREFINS